MLKHTITFAAVAGLVLALAPAAQAAISLPDPDAVGAYRLAFVTSIKPGSSDPRDMASLNAWVTGLAEAVPELDALGITWSVIGATTTVDVFTNTDTEPGVDSDHPIYLVNGSLFADDYAQFWSNTNYVALNIDENGNVASNGATWVQTGLNVGPVTYVGHELDGVGEIGHGGLDGGYQPWYGNADTWGGSFGASGLFAISGEIPEPATMALLALGGLGILIRRRRRS